jgi:hypothetical protein
MCVVSNNNKKALSKMISVVNPILLVKTFVSKIIKKLSQNALIKCLYFMFASENRANITHHIVNLVELYHCFLNKKTIFLRYFLNL